MATMNNCWICGALADSAEHMIKASDIRSMFGKIDNNHSLFRRVDNQKYERVAGIKSNKLKFSRNLCKQCNNSRTQVHDKSWEKLSTYLRYRNPKIKAGDKIRLSSIFPDGIRKGMLGVHLFFIKLFGCLIDENEIPIDTKEFAKCILHGHSHPNVFLSFLATSNKNFERQAVITPVNVYQKGEFISAQWMYIVGSFAINIVYAGSVRSNRREVHLWHPTQFDKYIVLDRFGKNLHNS